MMKQIKNNNPPIIIHNINPPILNPKFLPLILFFFKENFVNVIIIWFSNFLQNFYSIFNSIRVKKSLYQ